MSYTWTWDPSDLSTANGLCFAGDDSSLHIIVGTNDKIYYSSDQGVTWIPTESDFSNANVLAVASTADGSMMFAVVGTSEAAGNEIYNSINYGVNWTAITDPPSTEGITSICCNGNAAGTVNVFCTTAYGAGAQTGRIYQVQFTAGAQDANWTTGIVTQNNFTGIACTSGGSAYLAITSIGTIYQTGTVTSPPNTWTSTGAPSASWSGIACSSDNSTFIACNDTNPNGSIYTGTYSSGWTFTQKYLSDGLSFNYAAIGTTGTKLYASYPGGYIYSLDSGSTWTSDTSKTGVYSIRARRPSIIGPTAGLPLVLGVNSSANLSGVYYATYTLTPICFKEGTKILCFVDGKETYLPVETLKPGTFVKTYLHGYKAIDMIGHSKIYNPAHTLRGKNRLYVCKKEKYPEVTEDLIITGCHSILVDSITKKQEDDIRELTGHIYATDRLCRLAACLDDRAEPYTEEGVHTIWHFALAHKDYFMNYGVYANGLLVESTSRRMMKELSGMELV